MTLVTLMEFSVSNDASSTLVSNSVGMDYFIHLYTGLPYSDKANTALWTIPAWQHSLIVSILSAGTFFGALLAGDSADYLGRKRTIIGACLIFLVGVIMQAASTDYKLLVAGRAIGGIG
jgi:MFS transporter, SP family, sugar:H+ symporter